MVWQSPPTFVAALQAQLAACAAWTAAVGAGNETARIHFPVANPGGTLATADALPLAVLIQGEDTFTRYVEGGGSLPGGSLEIDLYLPVTTNGGATTYQAGDAETLASTLIRQLMLQTPIIPFIGTGARAMARDPTVGSLPGDVAGAPTAYRTISIRLPYGLTA